MKYLFALLILAGSTTSGQEIPKRCTEIALKNVTFSNALKVLSDNDYFIDKKDESAQTVITIEKAIGTSGRKKNINIVLFLRVKDSTLRISGKWNAPKMDAYSLDPIMYYGMKGSVPRMAWEAMEDFARLFKADFYYKEN